MTFWVFREIKGVRFGWAFDIVYEFINEMKIIERDKFWKNDIALETFLFEEKNLQSMFSNLAETDFEEIWNSIYPFLTLLKMYEYEANCIL